MRRFFDLRGEIIRRPTEFANVRARFGGLEELGPISDQENARLEEAQRTLRDLASQMRAFAENEPLAAWFVCWRYDPMNASAGLIGLSGSYDTYGSDRAFHGQTVATALRSNSNVPPPIRTSRGVCRDQAFEPHQTGVAKQIRTDLALGVVRFKFKQISRRNIPKSISPPLELP